MRSLRHLKTACLPLRAFLVMLRVGVTHDQEVLQEQSLRFVYCFDKATAFHKCSEMCQVLGEPSNVC